MCVILAHTGRKFPCEFSVCVFLVYLFSYIMVSGNCLLLSAVNKNFGLSTRFNVINVIKLQCILTKGLEEQN